MTLTAASVSVAYGSLTALEPVSFAVAPGTLLAVSGPSGAGKTTLLWALAGALEPTTGSVRLDGEPVTDRAAAAARGIAVVPQGNGLAAVLSARENLLVPLLDAGVTASEAADRTASALAQVGLEDWGDHLVEELSGGQQQRVAVARALAARPRVLLADEPTSDLDVGNRERILTCLRTLADAGTVVVVATHDEEAAAAADAELALDAGRPTWTRPLPPR